MPETTGQDRSMGEISESTDAPRTPSADARRTAAARRALAERSPLPRYRAVGRHPSCGWRDARRAMVKPRRAS